MGKKEEKKEEKKEKKEEKEEKEPKKDDDEKKEKRDRSVSNFRPDSPKRVKVEDLAAKELAAEKRKVHSEGILAKDDSDAEDAKRPAWMDEEDKEKEVEPSKLAAKAAEGDSTAA